MLTSDRSSYVPTGLPVEFGQENGADFVGWVDEDMAAAEDLEFQVSSENGPVGLSDGEIENSRRRSLRLSNLPATFFSDPTLRWRLFTWPLWDCVAPRSAGRCRTEGFDLIRWFCSEAPGIRNGGRGHHGGRRFGVEPFDVGYGAAFQVDAESALALECPIVEGDGMFAVHTPADADRPIALAS